MPLGAASRVHALDHANGTLLAVADGGRILLWRRDEAGWLVLDTPEGGDRHAAALSPDGAGVYVGEGTRVLSAPIRKHLRAFRTFFGADAPVSWLRWSPRGDVLLVGSGEQTSALDWSGRTLWTRQTPGPVAWDPGGGRLAAATQGGLQWLDGATGAELDRLELDPTPSVFALGPVVATADAALLTLHSPSGRLEVDPPPPAPVRALALSPGADSVAAACADGTCVAWDLQGRPRCSVRTPLASLEHVVWLDPGVLAVAGIAADVGPAVVLLDLGG